MAIPSFHTLPFLAMLCLVPLVIHAEVPNPSCDDAFASRILLFNESATASPIKNLLSTKDSLRIVIRRGLEKAFPIQREEQGNEREISCPKGCRKAAVYSAELFSEPEQVLRDPESLNDCLSYFLRTQRSPLSYGPYAFTGLNEFEAWFQELSQGKNAPGRRLYSDCPGRCSPKYSIQFKQNNYTIEVNVSVICGLPRDKYHNRYKVSAARILRCIRIDDT